MMRAAVLAAPGEMRIDARAGARARPRPGADAAGGLRRLRLQPEPWAGPDWMQLPERAGRARARGLGRRSTRSARASTGLGVGDRVAALSYRSYAEYDVADADAVVPLPAALAGQPFPGEPLGCAMNIFRRSDIAPGQTVAIIGIGFLGAILTRLASDAGARVIAISRRPISLDLAARAWARPRPSRWTITGRIIERVKELTGGGFCERVIEAVGKQWPLDLAAELMRQRRPAGRRRLPPGRAAAGQHAALELAGHRRDQRPRARPGGLPARACARRSTAVASGRLDPAPLYTHVYPLERLGEALDATRDRPDGFLKALVTHGMSARQRRPASASSASAGSAATAWRPCSRPARSRPWRSPIPSAEMAAAGGDAGAGRGARRRAGRPARARARRRGDRHAERAARRAVDPGAGARVPRCSARSRSGATPREARAVVAAARAADRLLAVDLSYRFTAGMRRIARAGPRRARSGDVYAVDLVFHNAYGPDKPWFYDRALSGGGCVMDLGVHLVDLALWALDFPALEGAVSATLTSAGRPLPRDGATVEDYARRQLSSSPAGTPCASPAHGGCTRAATPRSAPPSTAPTAGPRSATSTAPSTTSPPSATAAPHARRSPRRPTPGAAARPPTGRCGWAGRAVRSGGGAACGRRRRARPDLRRGLTMRFAFRSLVQRPCLTRLTLWLLVQKSEYLVQVVNLVFSLSLMSFKRLPQLRGPGCRSHLR